ncbi:uncharacterized protein RJT20DRAFT_147459 [Scheffersomyces xylosifermentans]|uniref:uncharacterized protein n=1 Tax=Scheffersomyces xylosifermentans TaxID=1304137 RepID=UPI00315D0C31
MWLAFVATLSLLLFCSDSLQEDFLPGVGGQELLLVQAKAINEKNPHDAEITSIASQIDSTTESLIPPLSNLILRERDVSIECTVTNTTMMVLSRDCPSSTDCVTLTRVYEISTTDEGGNPTLSETTVSIENCPYQPNCTATYTEEVFIIIPTSGPACTPQSTPEESCSTWIVTASLTTYIANCDYSTVQTCSFKTYVTTISISGAVYFNTIEPTTITEEVCTTETTECSSTPSVFTYTYTTVTCTGNESTPTSSSTEGSPTSENYNESNTLSPFPVSTPVSLTSSDLSSPVILFASSTSGKSDSSKPSSFPTVNPFAGPSSEHSEILSFSSSQQNSSSISVVPFNESGSKSDSPGDVTPQISETFLSSKSSESTLISTSCKQFNTPPTSSINKFPTTTPYSSSKPANSANSLPRGNPELSPSTTNPSIHPTSDSPINGPAVHNSGILDSRKSFTDKPEVTSPLVNPHGGPEAHVSPAGSTLQIPNVSTPNTAPHELPAKPTSVLPLSFIPQPIIQNSSIPQPFNTPSILQNQQEGSASSLRLFQSISVVALYLLLILI